MIRPNYWGVVMLSKILNAAIWATVLSASVAGAQSLSQLGGPSNLPPAGFDGQQFVDNRGCLFLRAGFGTTVTWVPRVDRGHRPLCGFPPTFGAAVIAAVEADMAPDPQARVVAAPARVVPTAPVVVARPVAVAEPLRAATATDMAGPASGQIRCWSSAPRLERVLLRAGGTALVCTRGDGTLSGWRSPVFPQGAAVGAALTPGIMAGGRVVGSGARSGSGSVLASNAVPTPPPGYKLAWKDDRLNPLRGLGTAEGQARQDQVWTRDVPAVLVTAAPDAGASPVRTARASVTVSTMSAPQAPTLQAQPVTRQPAATAASYVQVGAFGVSANAEAVKARLRALGLPVSTAKTTRKGKVVQVVYAGPFGSADEARSALGMARSAGFGDAILR